MVEAEVMQVVGIENILPLSIHWPNHFFMLISLPVQLWYNVQAQMSYKITRAT